jgi:hypothetical protein
VFASSTSYEIQDKPLDYQVRYGSQAFDSASSLVLLLLNVQLILFPDSRLSMMQLGSKKRADFKKIENTRKFGRFMATSTARAFSSPCQAGRDVRKIRSLDAAMLCGEEAVKRLHRPTQAY